MSKLRAFLIRLTGSFRKRAQDREVAAEFESHFQMHIEDNVRAGMSLEEAQREALLKFGGVESGKESMRDRSTLVWLETTWQDLRYGARGLARNRGFALAAILSLALGLGASVAIFTVADNLLLRPLPYKSASQLMMVWEYNLRGKGMGNHNSISPGNYFDWKAQNEVFASMAAFGEGHSVFADGSHVEELDIQYMAADLLPMLGIQPIRGRFFTPSEDKPGSGSVVLISYRLWQSWFGGQDNIVGRKVQVSSVPFTIVGVMPADFYFRNRSTDLWAPLGLDPAQNYRAVAGRWLMCLAKLKAGVTRQQAQARMSAIAQRLEAAYPKFDTNWSVNVEPLRDSLVREVKASLLVLMGAVGLLLAVACANVASLLLARYTSRRREMGVRASLGAGRPRVMRQLLTESIMLALAGGMTGMLFAKWAVRALIALAPKDLTSSVEVTVDLRIYLFALGLAILTGLIFGLAPALVGSGDGLASVLHQDSRSSIGGNNRLRSFFVGAEVAMAVMLLIGALLLFRSLAGLQAVNPGLNPSNLLTFRVSLPLRYKDAQRIQFFSRAVDRMKQLPGMRSVSAVSYLPLSGGVPGTDLTIEGRPAAKPGEGSAANVRAVMPGYFQTMGIPLKNGRVFTPADNTPSSPYRFVVNEAFVHKYFSREQPLGAQISVDMEPKNPFGQIIGVVADAKESTLDERPEPTVYYVHAHLVYSSMTFVVRTEKNPMAMAEAMRGVIRGVDSAQPVADVRSMDEIMADTFSRQRFSMLLLAGFSITSLVLAAIGIYGVLAYSVSERTREIGVRVALGAEPRRIISLVIAAGGRMVLGGTVIGIAGALALSGFLKSMLFGIGPRDPLTFVLVPLILAGVALIAAYLPARRAAHLDPMYALRAD